MAFDVFNIFIGNKSQALMASVGPPISIAFREALESEAVRLQKLALAATKAAVPILTTELQQDIIPVTGQDQWRVSIQGTIHLSGHESISTDALAFKLDTTEFYKRSHTNPGFGGVSVSAAGVGAPPAEWIRHAQAEFSQLAGF